MPKMKTNRGAAKRFKRNGGGGFKRIKAFKSHILTKKTLNVNCICVLLLQSVMRMPALCDVCCPIADLISGDALCRE